MSGYLKREALARDDHSEEGHDAVLTEIFDEEDKNKDGYISHDEFQGIKHGGEL